MRAIALTLLMIGTASGEPPKKKNTLTEKEIQEGWILLFDGETTFGWTGDTKNVTIKDGMLTVTEGTIKVPPLPPGMWQYNWMEDGRQNGIGESFGRPVTAEIKSSKAVYNVKYQPNRLNPLFNGKDLTGWKLFEGDAKRKASKFEVTKDGELKVTNGPGDLQTEAKYADFLLQFECKTNGTALNSGIFFRCLPDQYQQGYECQIQNAFVKERTKPLDYGTGAIYRRVPARTVVSNDNEWFTVTVLAVGPHLRTWVNGYPVVDWKDDRKPAENARNGQYLKAGHLSIQGHDPTTDILFRNIRIVEIKP